MYDQVLSATRYALSLKETALRFVEAGLLRNIRSLQRFPGSKLFRPPECLAYQDLGQRFVLSQHLIMCSNAQLPPRDNAAQCFTRLPNKSQN